jgi:hypothetical protein
MTSKLMYFGTQERMTWVKCPTFDMNMSKVGWGASSQYVNGGAGVRRSVTSHKEYSMAWNLASHVDISEINDYADGLYGDGLIYFLDPFAIDTNLLPQYWAAPRIGAKDGPVLNGSLVRPTEVETEANSFSYPTQSAAYTFDASSKFASLYIPLPTGYTFHFGAHGNASGTAAVAVSTSNQTTTTTYRINQSTNSSFEVDTSGWTTSGSPTVSRPLTGGFAGSAHLRLTATAATTLLSANGTSFVVTPGEQVAMSSYVRGTVGRLVQMRVTYTGASAVTSTTAALVSTSAWQRIFYTGTVPVGATAARVDVVMTAASVAVGNVLDIDAVLAERGTAGISTYFDGSTPNTSVANIRTYNTWQGATHNSASQQSTVTAPGTAMTLLPSTSPVLTNYTISGVPGVHISFWGSGNLTLSGMIAQVLPTGAPAPMGDFISGKGHSGCRFAPGSPSEQGYSAALDLRSLTATLIETGAWE